MHAKIPLMAAYTIETLAKSGHDRKALAEKIHAEDIQALKALDDSFDYEYLLETNKTSSFSIERALLEPYQVKFITINGLKLLLDLKFNLLADRDYLLEEKKLTGLTLDIEGLAELEILLSSNWKIAERQEVENGIIQFEIWHSTLLESH